MLQCDSHVVGMVASAYSSGQSASLCTVICVAAELSRPCVRADGLVLMGSAIHEEDAEVRTRTAALMNAPDCSESTFISSALAALSRTKWWWQQWKAWNSPLTARLEGATAAAGPVWRP